MTFTEVVAAVNEATRRPDKIAVARRKVNSAISFYTMDTRFQRDYAEKLQTIDATQFTQSIALSNFTRFRAFDYIKLGGTKTFILPLPDSERLNINCDCRNRYYIAGSNVNVSLTTLVPTLDVGYWMYAPRLSDLVTENSHWMLDMAPDMIIDWAAGEVFKEIGDEKSFREHKVTARDLYMAFRRDQGIANQ